VTTSNREYLIYADGSCLGNPGPGGWGVVLRDPDGAVREYNGSATATTNNRMELTGAIEGLRATEPGAQIVLRSDSLYVINTMTKNWKRNANRDLWEMLDKEAQIRKVKFEWVRGHDVDPINNRADVLAVMGAKGRLVAEESNGSGETELAGVADQQDERAAEKISSLLKTGERLRACEACGETFVSARADEKYCSHVVCQIEARSKK
jgi:ribonuclease HI